MFYVIIIVLITLLLNYAMVKQENECNNKVKEIKESQEIDELLNIYVDIPDIFKQYYIENNYGSLSKVTEGMFDDPNLAIYSYYTN